MTADPISAEERKPPRLGTLEVVECRIVACPTCGELRYAELACLPCDTFGLTLRLATKCICFDWPEEADEKKKEDDPNGNQT